MPIATERLIQASNQLKRRLNKFDFSAVADWVYNPLDYAWDAYCEYLERFARPSTRVLFLGMNPGPWGMMQTGIPFGEVAAVKRWLQIESKVKKPRAEHPKRPIQGFECKRSEVSGRRLWGLFEERFGTPDRFFKDHFVFNYCPLAFLSSSGSNITPDKFPATIRREIETICDEHLATFVETLQPDWLIGVGAFAESSAKRTIESRMAESRKPPSPPPKIGRILHPSPASPAANRDWSGEVTRSLIELGIWKPKQN